MISALNIPCEEIRMAIRISKIRKKIEIHIVCAAYGYLPLLRFKVRSISFMLVVPSMTFRIPSSCR